MAKFKDVLSFNGPKPSVKHEKQLWCLYIWIELSFPSLSNIISVTDLRKMLD